MRERDYINLRGFMHTDHLKVCLPWNTRNYVPTNGFHPLYSFLIEKTIDNSSDNNDIEFLTHNENLWKDCLVKPESREAILGYVKSVSNRLDRNIESDEFWRFFDINEVVADESSCYDLKIVHTSLITCSLKPWLYHLESFETLFFPWQIETPLLEGVSIRKIEKIKSYLKNQLEHPNCLGIVSHVQKTLQRFRDFFKSDIINNKLFYSPLGVNQPKVLPQKEIERPRRFLFSTSFHGNIDNLVMRGLISCFKFISEWIKLYPDDEFIFTSQQPDYSLLSNSISFKLYEDVIKHGNVIFLGGGYIADEEFSLLLTQSDYIFLLTYQLHSLSLLRSMANGVIPIVMDLPEIINYGVSEENAILLKIYSKLAQKDNPVFGSSPTVESFLLETQNVIPVLIKRLQSLRQNPSLEVKMIKNAYSLISRMFDVVEARISLINILKSQYSKYKCIETRMTISSNVDFAYQDRFGSLSYFLPPLRLVKSQDFDKRATAHEILCLGYQTIYGNGDSYVSLPITCNSMDAADIVCVSLRCIDVLCQIQNGNYLTYHDALIASFSVLDQYKYTGLRQHLRRYVLRHHRLKMLLRPLYRGYKALKARSILAKIAP